MALVITNNRITEFRWNNCQIGDYSREAESEFIIISTASPWPLGFELPRWMGEGRGRNEGWPGVSLPGVSIYTSSLLATQIKVFDSSSSTSFLSSAACLQLCASFYPCFQSRSTSEPSTCAPLQLLLLSSGPCYSFLIFSHLRHLKDSWRCQPTWANCNRPES